MWLQFVYCKLLFITYIYASNSTSLETNHDLNGLIPKELQDSNKTKVTMVSEGGSIVSSASTLTLPEDVHSISLSLDKELDKTKERTVVPRKGVKYTPLDDDSTSLHSTELKGNDKEEKKPVIPQQGSKELITYKMDEKNDIHKLAGDKLNTTNKNVSNIVQTPLKPLVVSYEGLSEIDQLVKKEKLNKLHTETKSSPDPDTNIIRVQTVNASHPGMIMPIIITILTVPLFAVLGYLALRRGQEAWKNRHYKRMDFLLDALAALLVLQSSFL